MRNVIVLLGLLTVGSEIFAQQFFIDGNFVTNFQSVTPTFGMGIRFGWADVLAGASFTVYRGKHEYGSSYSDYDYSEKLNSAGIYTGVAPKAISKEKWTLSFPLILQVAFGETSGKDYEDSHIPVQADDLEHLNYVGIAFLAGSNAAYSLSEHWSFLAGFLFNIFEYEKYANTYYKTTSQADGTYSVTARSTAFLKDGTIQLGVRFTI